jgi:hypothetical protein
MAVRTALLRADHSVHPTAVPRAVRMAAWMALLMAVRTDIH